MTDGEIIVMFFELSIPTVSQNFLGYGISVINLYFVGLLDNAAMTAAFGLAQTFITVTGLSLMLGSNSAQETLTSQAFGAGELRRCGVLLNRGRAFLTVLFVPVAIIFYCSDKILLLIRIDPETATLAS